jgi:hypothetical protein
MDAGRLDAVLAECERQLDGEGSVDLRSLGLWRAVGTVKRDPALVERHADRIAAIDRAAFERWAWLAVPISVGTMLMVVLALAGIAVVGVAYYLDEPWNGLFLLAGTGILEASTHTLAHLAVGRSSGIRFTHWFVGSPTRPQPGVKTDYASYLRAPARSRAWMHASGAIVTKLMPFLLLGAAWGMGAPTWAWMALTAIGVLQIVTDVTLSVKQSDWKRFRREMRVAAEVERGRGAVAGGMNI